MKRFALMSIFAGILIGTGGLVYLRVGGVAGAVLFAFGLLCVVMCGAQLFTGKSGFLPYKESWRLLPMLLGNAVGCMIMACVTRYVANGTVDANLYSILDAREAASWHGLLVTSAGTGMIMTLAVYGARRKHYLPLLFGVPVFILCGLPHCVADAYYYAVALLNGGAEWSMLGAWGWAIVGNYVGCNLPRWLMGKEFEV
ncbi:MAG: formate/nitrite transporter family protein [Alistipes sp.]|nr:formate/nitrite transporter family protein [Alistipes sp.]MBQ3246694.1 formate/nitrite transporter family protein [Alistipes sp.]